MSATFFIAVTARRSASSGASLPASSAGGDMISSISRFAAGISGSPPLTARRASIPGMSRRLISFVPSKMRFTRASR